MYKPDEGRAWAVLIAAIIATGFITDGIGYSFGLIYIELLRVYDQSKEVTSWIGSFQQAIGYMCCLLYGYIAEKTSSSTTILIFSVVTAASFALSILINNIYLLYVTLGGLSGIGLVGVELASEVIVQRWFVKKRLLANGIFCSGTGWGLLVMGPIIEWLINSYGLHGTFLILAAFSLNGIVASMLIPTTSPMSDRSTEPPNTGSYDELKETNTETKTKISGSNKETPSQYQSIDKVVPVAQVDQEKNEKPKQSNWMKRFRLLLRNKRYMIYTIGSVLGQTTMKTTIVYFPDRAVKDFQLTSEQSAILLMVLGATNIFGRPFLGFIGRNGFTVQKKQIVLALSSTIAGVGSFASIWFNTMVLQVIFVIAFGISCATMVTFEYPVLCDVIDLEDLEKAAGFYHSLLGVAILFYVPFSGWLVDVTGTYVMTFICLGIVQFISSVILFILPSRCIKSDAMKYYGFVS